MDSIWVSLVVAVLGVLGVLGSQLLSSRAAARNAEGDRQAQREENAKQRDSDRQERVAQRQADREDQLRRYRQDAYSALVVAARAFSAALSTPASPEDGDAALGSLRKAVADVELNAPELVDGPLTELLDAAERLHSLVVRGMATRSVIDETATEFEQAVRGIRSRMWDDIGTRARL